MWRHLGVTWLQQAGALVLENYIMDIHKYYLLVGPFNFLKLGILGGSIQLLDTYAF